MDGTGDDPAESPEEQRLEAQFDDSEKRRRRRLLWLKVVIGVAVAAGAIVIYLFIAGHASGRVIAKDTPFGSYTYAMHGCTSGTAYVPQFFGAELKGSGGNEMRVIGTGSDATVVVFAPGATKRHYLLSSRACSKWDVHVEWSSFSSGNNGQHVQGVNGHVHLRCRIGGGEIRVDTSFLHCTF